MFYFFSFEVSSPRWLAGRFRPNIWRMRSECSCSAVFNSSSSGFHASPFSFTALAHSTRILSSSLRVGVDGLNIAVSNHAPKGWAGRKGHKCRLAENEH